MEVEVNGNGAAYPMCLIEKLIRVREITRDLLKKQLIKDDVWFLVDQKWFAAFGQYVGLYSNSAQHIGEKHPGPVDNSSLLKDNELKEGIQDGIDFVYVPGELWWNLISWFGTVEDQEPISRKVIEFGLFVKDCVIEINTIRLRLCKDFDISFAILDNFSRSDLIVHLAERSRKLYQIKDDTDVRMWSFASNFYELLDLTSNVYYEALDTNQIIVVETRMADGNWRRRSEDVTNEDVHIHRGDRTSQSDNTSRSSEEQKLTDVCSGEEQMQSTKDVPGLCGLRNLGNTCFMNSIIQCMSNCPPLTQYFLDDDYKKDLNLMNPMGQRGETASAYGELLKILWSGQHSETSPKNFKRQIGKIAPQFLGSHQHDCHELLAVVLDGLHEDLNRITTKPYIAVRDSEGRTDQELADECWGYHLNRNDSIIVDNFHGLLKSAVICGRCNKTSVKFDPFCYLSLPLPMKNERLIEVTLFFDNPWKAPKVFKVTVPKNGLVHDLLLGLNQLCGICPDDLLVTEVARCRFKKFFSNEDSITGIGLDSCIVAYHVPNVENHIRVPVILWEQKTQKYSLTHLFGHPFMVVVPEDSCTAEMVYELVLMKLFRHLTTPDQRGAMWLLQLSENYDDSEISVATLKSFMSSLPGSLFSLHVIQASVVHKFPDDAGQASALFADKLGRRYLAAQWKPEDRAQYFSEQIYDKEKHESVNKVQSDSTTLLECLQLYTTCEKLGSDDAWYCPACRKHQQASKKIELWRLPAILVIHLKRFSYTEYSHNKITMYVDFPMEDFDLSKFVIDCKHPSTKYKLICVCNHFGTLSSGHYKAYVLNKTTNQWYEFDDHRVKKLPSSSVVTESAYVLFYLRQD